MTDKSDCLTPGYCTAARGNNFLFQNEDHFVSLLQPRMSNSMDSPYQMKNFPHYVTPPPLRRSVTPPPGHFSAYEQVDYLVFPQLPLETLL